MYVRRRCIAPAAGEDQVYGGETETGFQQIVGEQAQGEQPVYSEV